MKNYRNLRHQIRLKNLKKQKEQKIKNRKQKNRNLKSLKKMTLQAGNKNLPVKVAPKKLQLRRLKRHIKTRSKQM